MSLCAGHRRSSILRGLRVALHRSAFSAGWSKSDSSWDVVVLENPGGRLLEAGGVEHHLSAQVVAVELQSLKSADGVAKRLVGVGNAIDAAAVDLCQSQIG